MELTLTNQTHGTKPVVAGTSFGDISRELRFEHRSSGRDAERRRLPDAHLLRRGTVVTDSPAALSTDAARVGLPGSPSTRRRSS